MKIISDSIHFYGLITIVIVAISIFAFDVIGQLRVDEPSTVYQYDNQVKTLYVSNTDIHQICAAPLNNQERELIQFSIPNVNNRSIAEDIAAQIDDFCVKGNPQIRLPVISDVERPRNITLEI